MLTVGFLNAGCSPFDDWSDLADDDLSGGSMQIDHRQFDADRKAAAYWTEVRSWNGNLITGAVLVVILALGVTLAILFTSKNLTPAEPTNQPPQPTSVDRLPSGWSIRTFTTFVAQPSLHLETTYRLVNARAREIEEGSSNLSEPAAAAPGLVLGVGSTQGVGPWEVAAFHVTNPSIALLVVRADGRIVERVAPHQYFSQRVAIVEWSDKSSGGTVVTALTSSGRVVTSLTIP
jgi:hypothetical protein